MNKYVLNRDVSAIECSWLAIFGQYFVVPEGTIVYEAQDTWHCCTPNGVFVSMKPNSKPAFELPTDAVTVVARTMGTCEHCLREWIPLEDDNICERCSGVYS